MADQTRWVKRTIDALEKQGWTYRYNGKHYVLYPADKRFKPIAVSCTPSGTNGQVNAIKQLRKAGAKI